MFDIKQLQTTREATKEAIPHESYIYHAFIKNYHACTVTGLLPPRLCFGKLRMYLRSTKKSMYCTYVNLANVVLVGDRLIVSCTLSYLGATHWTILHWESYIFNNSNLFSPRVQSHLIFQDDRRPHVHISLLSSHNLWNGPMVKTSLNEQCHCTFSHTNTSSR
jgi:hypothetical protein